MTKIPCCVPGCFDRESKRHRFPKDRDFMQKWIKSVNNRAVEDAEPEQIYNRYYVCQRHFADKHIVPGTKRGLSAVAVPTLFLPRSSEETTNIGKSAISFVENVLEGMSLSTAIKEVEKNKEVALTNTELIETLTDNSPVFSSIDIKEVVNPSEVTLELPVALENSVTSSKLEETVPRDEVAENKPVLPPKSEKSYCDDEVKNLLGKCRLCLLNPGLYIIAQEEHLSQQIVDYIQIELVETPNYPQLICRCCKTIMDTIHSFFTKAHKANLTLKNALTNTTNKVKDTFKTEDTPETFNETTDCQPLAEVTQDLNKQCKEEANIPPIERRFKCEFCHQSFVLVSQYRRHKKLHRVFYVCNKAGCGRTFSEEQNFKRHLQYHNQRNTNYKLALKHKKYTCRICKKYFVSLKLLTQHRESHTNIECPVDDCTIILKNWKTFDTHMMTHTERKTYLCQVCGKTFSTRIGLASHEKVHRGVRYNCDVCEASYTSKKTLSEHMQVKHEGVRFYCSMCPNSYATKVSLRCHEKAHTGQRDYHCTFCPKSFLAKKNLIYHMLVHQGLRPFQCQVCFKSYSAKSTLQCHEKIHTGQKYICTVEGCKKLLTRIDRLRNHIKTKHPEHCNVDNNT